MNEQSINEVLNTLESAFEINVTHKLKGTTYPKVIVFGSNTLDQILKEYAGDIGINPNAHWIKFENKRTVVQTSDKTMTITEFGLIGGDHLLFIDWF